jgi:microcystin-dependent protein
MTYRLKDLYNNNLNHRKRIFHTGGDIIGDLAIYGSVSISKDAFVEGRVYEKKHILLPAGTVVQSAAIHAPAGWVECDGRQLPKNDPQYADLFNAIGTKYGGSDLSFNVPDFRGRVAVGVGHGVGLTSRLLGAKGGEETHTLTVGEMPEHAHTGTTNSSGEHTHTYQDVTAVEAFGSGDNNKLGINGSDTDNGFYWRDADGNQQNTPQNINTGSSGAHYHNFTTDTSGNNLPHNNMQPFLVVRYIIKL